jgi:hypothetical protein
VDAPRDDRGFLLPDAVRGLFDRAVAHWNARRYFEAHEDWETLWNDAEGPRREWLQGLIQFAAAFHHYGRGGASGFGKLMRSASDKCRGYGGDTEGLDFARLWAELEPWIAHGAAVAAGTPLSKAAPEPIPRLHRLPGVVAAPYPFEPEDDLEPENPAEPGA